MYRLLASKVVFGRGFYMFRLAFFYRETLWMTPKANYWESQFCT
jgi:hypothetical protein